jgi:hypothetical protein
LSEFVFRQIQELDVERRDGFDKLLDGWRNFFKLSFCEHVAEVGMVKVGGRTLLLDDLGNVFTGVEAV